MSTTEACDLCGSLALEKVYQVPGTARGLSVHVCRVCGLAQSLPRIDHVPRNSPFPDSGAGFGNIRYGKGFRTAFALQELEKYIQYSNVETCLDIGANRGSFLLALLERAPHIKAVAIEPDERVLDAYSDHKAITLLNDRVENIDMGEDKFDIIYHCHTLEHQAYPLKSLKAVCRALRGQGIMFLEVPNIEFLNGMDIVEEWFIDKHLYHYSLDTLSATVQEAGFEILQVPDPRDTANITIIAKPAKVAAVSNQVEEFQKTKDTIERYDKTLKFNQQRLQLGAGRLRDFCMENRVAIWGAGRIYTSIVDVGKFDPKLLCSVVDKSLHQYVDEMFGVSVEEPEQLKATRPEFVLVASRLYFNEIKSELSGMLPATKVLTLEDVLEGNIGVNNV